MEWEMQLWYSQVTSAAYTNVALKEIVFSLLRKIFLRVFNPPTTGNCTDEELGASASAEPGCL